MQSSQTYYKIQNTIQIKMISRAIVNFEVQSGFELSRVDHCKKLVKSKESVPKFLSHIHLVFDMIRSLHIKMRIF